jgi:hypothetical protein
MKDIDITKSRNRLLYYTGIIGMLILFLASYSVVFVIYMVIYLKTRHNKPKKKNVLNLPYQKFVFVVGNLFLIFFVVVTLIALLMFYPAPG